LPSSPSLAKLAAKRLQSIRSSEAGSLGAFAKRYADDFYGFCDLLEIKPKEAVGSGLVPFKLTRIQREFCEERTGRDVILKARQVKITSIELARDVWFFLTKPGTNTRVYCQSGGDSNMLAELSERIGVYLDALRRNAGLRLQFTTESRSAWTLPTGSTLKIVEAGASAAAAQKKSRGETVHRIHTTELAFWEWAGLTLNAATKAIAGPEHGTEIVHESTPNGAVGDELDETLDASGAAYFYRICKRAERGEGEYKFHFFSWLQCDEYETPLLPGETIEPETERERAIVALKATPAQLKWYRARVNSPDGGQTQTDQEYASDPQTCFIVSGTPFFERSITEALIARACEPREKRRVHRLGAVGTVRILHPPEKGQSYVVSLDTSEGSGGDGGAGFVYERGSGRHMATIHGQFKPHELAAEGATVGRQYNDGRLPALIVVERNNHGSECLYALRVTVGYPLECIYHDRDEKPGWLTSAVSRTHALDLLEQAHRGGFWTTTDRLVLGEFRTFVIKEKRAEHAKGAKDDLVLAAAIGWDVICQPIKMVRRHLRI
jgi:hypothetical protein